ncbi:MAG TPA: Gfo/Idh/MocA family oxidoreductase [Alphaproteobacteria bacterium]|nr:Gfo/Idh/MocA family oxidoreductase [Alphaproteobacteria bacterium]
MVRKLNIGVVGCGEAARRIYLPEFHRLHDQAVLAAVCDRVEARAKATKERFGAKAYYTDLDRFLRQSDADIVVNLTPQRAHVPVSRAALQAGKHVYTEKVMAETLDEATQLIDLAADQRVKFACAPVTLLLPTYRRWQALIRQGAIGRVTFARAQGLYPPIWDDFSPEHVWYFAAGSGPLMDMGVYPLTALTGLFGPVLRVSAMAKTIMPERVIGDGPAAGQRFPMEVEDSVHLHLDFGGFFASVDLSWCVQASRNACFEVYGESATLSGDPTSANTPLHMFRTGQAWEVEDILPRLPRHDDWFQGVAHLVKCVLENTEPVNNAVHARHVLDIMLTALRAAREGRTLELQTTF